MNSWLENNMIETEKITHELLLTFDKIEREILPIDFLCYKDLKIKLLGYNWNWDDNIFDIQATCRAVIYDYYFEKE